MDWEDTPKTTVDPEVRAYVYNLVSAVRSISLWESIMAKKDYSLVELVPMKTAATC